VEIHARIGEVADDPTVIVIANVYELAMIGSRELRYL
jgi:hypothetical protein